MRRIKLIVALAAAMVVLMMAAAPAMANIIDTDHGNNFRSGNFGDGLVIFSFTNSSGLLDNGAFDDGDVNFDFGGTDVRFS